MKSLCTKKQFVLPILGGVRDIGTMISRQHGVLQISVLLACQLPSSMIS